MVIFKNFKIDFWIISVVVELNYSKSRHNLFMFCAVVESNDCRASLADATVRHTDVLQRLPESSLRGRLPRIPVFK